MEYIQGQDRKQLMLYAECLDDYIDSDSEAKVIDTFVEKLDLRRVGINRTETLPATQGRPVYPANVLIKIYLYGLLNKVRTSRRLEWLTKTNIEVKWLTGNITPDHKTISDFRRENLKGIKEIFKIFILFLREQELVDGQILAADGTKIKANSSRDKIYTIEKLDKIIKEAEEQIEEYLDKMNKADQEDKARIINQREPEAIKRIIEKIEDKLKEYENIKEQMQRRGEEKISLADKDARLMKTKEGKIPSYNHQIVVDNKKHFIIAEETIRENTDNHQINKIIDQVKQILPEAEKIVFDSGYYDGEEILKSSNRMDVYVALKKDIETKAEGFEYDKDKDVYICPAKEELKYSSKAIQRGKLYRRYTTKGCKNCNIREGCTTSKNGRSIKRYIHEDIIELHRQKVKSEEGKELIKKRKGIVENVFGSIKLSLGKLPLLTRGLNNVKTENTLHCIAYNLRRLLNELSVEDIINSLNKWEVKYSQ